MALAQLLISGQALPEICCLPCGALLGLPAGDARCHSALDGLTHLMHEQGSGIALVGSGQGDQAVIAVAVLDSAQQILG